VDGASILMDRPPGGWNDLVTNESLRLSLDALRHELRTEMGGLRAEMQVMEHRLDAKMSELSADVDRRLRAQTWITTTTMLTGIGLVAAIARFF